ncbi:MAG: phenylpyruvate tautomerase MIF-related protein [Alphaproteobacteria bacterium]
MPMLKIQTNVTLAAEAAEALLTEASRTVAGTLGKPENYVMVSLQQGLPMMFAGSSAPLAYLELKSIGLADGQTSPASKALCALMDKALGVPPSRVYIEFANAPGRMWGYNGGTF